MRPLKVFQYKNTHLKTIAAIICCFLALVTVSVVLAPEEDYSISGKTRNLVQPLMQNQQAVDDDIKATIRSGNYSITSPLVIQNPYATAPLTALVIFTTSEPTQVTLHVPGKTPLAAVDNIFPEFTRYHEIPVYGLYADQTNQVTLTSETAAGSLESAVIELTTEPLPVYLDQVKVARANPDLYNPGMNFTFQDNKLVFDINGDIRWYSTQASFQTYYRAKNGHFLFIFTIPIQNNAVILEEDLLGRIYATYNIPDGAHHDLTELPNGNFLLTSQENAATTVEDHLIEVDRQSGFVIRNFDLKNYLDPSRPHEIGYSASDWIHFNSISYDETDQSILISSRVQSAVVKMSYPQMEIQWILGPHDNWTSQYQPYLLTPQGMPFEWAWSQHHAITLSRHIDEGDSIAYISLFDNGNYRSFDLKLAITPINAYSRMVVYRVNETQMTIEQAWAYGQERGSEIYSSSRGSAYPLENGNFLGTWSEILKDKNGLPLVIRQLSGKDQTAIIEVNPRQNQVVFEANLTATTSYRTFRAKFYDDFSLKSSNLAIVPNDTTLIGIERQIVLTLQRIRKKIFAISI